MDKFKPENTKEINNWILKHKAKEYVIEDKLDGVSCLLEYKNGSLKIYTAHSIDLCSALFMCNPDFLSARETNMTQHFLIKDLSFCTIAHLLLS